jgi:hypothetical protein
MLDNEGKHAENSVSFLKELREACGKKYGLTAVIPASYRK